MKQHVVADCLVNLHLFASGLVLLVIFAPFETASAYYRRRGSNAAAIARAQRQVMINMANAQRAAAMEVLAAAEDSGANAERRLSAATEKLQAASSELAGAKKNARDLEVHLRQLEKEILGEQKINGEYLKAVAESDQAKKNLAVLEAKILADPEVEKVLTGLTGSELKKAKTEVLDRWTDYAVAHTKAEAASKQVADIRWKLLTADQDWKETTETLREARRELAKAQDHVSSGAARLAPLQDRRKAANVASEAREAIFEAEMVLRSLGAMPPAKTPSSASSGKKGQ